MAIGDAGLRSLGKELKKQAIEKSVPVDDRFIIELGNYAHHMVVDELNEQEAAIVLKSIGETAIDEHQALNAGTIWATVQKLCRPKNAYDICAGAARYILNEKGHTNAVAKLDVAEARVLSKWSL